MNCAGRWSDSCEKQTRPLANLYYRGLWREVGWQRETGMKDRGSKGTFVLVPGKTGGI